MSSDIALRAVHANSQFSMASCFFLAKARREALAVEQSGLAMEIVLLLYIQERMFQKSQCPGSLVKIIWREIMDGFICQMCYCVTQIKVLFA